ncbi:uncharacterized protein LOC112594521 [Melanaphis sacchari]|uniref:uncharacterized protein LOC112594521 n=1 Tax=Melanaphis sacchari TaxID=742174 RepID=UPI000DC13F3B|nr:uncharacterized protein LOC112594521 [Melanaphis sacchari]
MEFVIRITILLAISSSWVAATENKDVEACIQRNKERRSGRLCPPMGYKDKYEVAFVQNSPVKYGCAFIEHDWQITDAPLLHLWMEEQLNDSPTYCKNTSNMNHYIFECLSKNEPTNEGEIDQGFQYMSLFEYTPNPYSQHINKSSRLSYRCAVYVADDHVNYGVVVIRMALSKGKANNFDVSQCEGLSKILVNRDLPDDPAVQQNWPEGVTYLFIMGDLQPKRRITTTTTSAPTTTTEPLEEKYSTFYNLLGILARIMPETFEFDD